MSQPSGARAAPRRRRSRRTPGCPWPRSSSAARADTVFTRIRLRAEVAREVARDGLERRLAHAHPVVDRPRDAAVEVEADDDAPPRFLHQRRACRRRAPSARTRLVWKRGRHALPRRVEEVAAERVLRRERDRVQEPVEPSPSVSSAPRCTASTCSGSFESISRTSGGVGSRRPLFSVRLIARPNEVSTISAPSSWRPAPSRTRWLRRQHAGDEQLACPRAACPSPWLAVTPVAPVEPLAPGRRSLRWPGWTPATSQVT